MRQSANTYISAGCTWIEPPAATGSPATNASPAGQANTRPDQGVCVFGRVAVSVWWWSGQQPTANKDKAVSGCWKSTTHSAQRRDRAVSVCWNRRPQPAARKDKAVSGRWKFGGQRTAYNGRGIVCLLEIQNAERRTQG